MGMLEISEVRMLTWSSDKGRESALAENWFLHSVCLA